MLLTLTRELRFGLHETELPPAPRAANGFAGNPPLVDIAPFLSLLATLRGPVDPQTGMLVNIKLVDRLLREQAVPFLRAAHYQRHIPAARILPELFSRLQPHFLPHELTTLRLAASPFLAYTTTLKEPAMARLTLRFEFSAAHRLHSDALSADNNVALFGRCNNPNGHGHNYELEVTISGTPDSNTGQIMPVPALQQIVNARLINAYDHKHLNLDCPEFKTLNPTVENIATTLFNQLKPHIPAPARLVSLRVWETPKTMCEITE